jgi:tetratricopeptide (TPR) repeat protein
MMLAIFTLGILAGTACCSVAFVLWLRRRVAPIPATPPSDVVGAPPASRPAPVRVSQRARRVAPPPPEQEPVEADQAGGGTETADAGKTREALLEEIERLENRMKRLEETRDAGSKAEPRPAPLRPTTPMLTRTTPAPAAPEPNVARLSLGRAKRVTLLLANTETLLKAGRGREALGSAEEVLALDPANLDALVKKGKALESLQRAEEAIAAYDRAIEIDTKSTIAYLRKGELFNKLERYNEALECYEKALATQQKNGDR